MPMKNPPHPGRIVKEALSALNLSVSEAAVGLGVSRYQLHRVVAGTSGVSAEMALRLEKGLGSTADTWLRMQAVFDAAQVRLRASDITVQRLGAKAAQSKESTLA